MKFSFLTTGKCYFYVTDGRPVYPTFIPDKYRTTGKTYVTKVEGKNPKLIHDLTRLYCETICYCKCAGMLMQYIKLLISCRAFELHIQGGLSCPPHTSFMVF
ncbi:hypothetical protein IQ270_27645 [Microcoleus sp. LEGE 07076]|uniref:IS1 family transposase n=1 Tax=Microcoleus sp. LEGE 07076 TaxID=915322 RepID=UPI00187FB4BB|nr:hypothetical protein [Microcoleus sp. LEGE 07076]